MALAIFDLDNTLLADDSDYLWGEFLAANKLVDVDWFRRENKRFLDAYNAGSLDKKKKRALFGSLKLRKQGVEL